MNISSIAAQRQARMAETIAAHVEDWLPDSMAEEVRTGTSDGAGGTINTYEAGEEKPCRFAELGGRELEAARRYADMAEAQVICREDDQPASPSRIFIRGISWEVLHIGPAQAWQRHVRVLLGRIGGKVSE